MDNHLYCFFCEIRWYLRLDIPKFWEWC